MVNECSEETLHSIELIRSMFIGEVNQNPELYDQVDVDKVSNDNFCVTRFLNHHEGDVDKGFAQLVDTMRWRKSFGVNSIKSSNFPQEYFQTGESHFYGYDKNGIFTVYLRVKLHKKISELSPLSQKYLVYLLEYCESKAKETGKGYGLVWDCLGGTLFNVDIELLQFLTTIWTHYYPGGAKYIILHEMPWILRAIYRLVQSWLPEDFRKQIKFADRKTISEFVGQEFLPDYLNGLCKTSYKTAPSHCKPMELMVKKDLISKDVFNKFMDHYRPYLNQK